MLVVAVVASVVVAFLLGMGSASQERAFTKPRFEEPPRVGIAHGFRYSYTTFACDKGSLLVYVPQGEAQRGGVGPNARGMMKGIMQGRGWILPPNVQAIDANARCLVMHSAAGGRGA
jgi:hypothetical protein